MTHYSALACDFDGTLATEGRVTSSAMDALRHYRASGGKLVLVTGRQLNDLVSVLSQLCLFDRVVAENGAVLYSPHDGARRLLTSPPSHRFIELLRRRGVEDLATGEVIIATSRQYDAMVQEVIDRAKMPFQRIYNESSLMVLPCGVNKGTGLEAAISDMGGSLHKTAAIGDAENDESMLAIAGLSVAVSDALPALKARADMVMQAANGAGVEELIAWLLRQEQHL
jgi:HAD superfamily hydrolase (TIGR01484 family)